MRFAGRTRGIGILLVVALALATCSDGGRQAADRELVAADRALDAGDWAAAFLGYRAVLAIDPDRPGARSGVDLAARQLIDAVPGLDVETEVPLLRWLESEGRWEDVARVLTSSVVTIGAGSATMGSDGAHLDEGPTRDVFLDEFTIDRYEVTNLAYARFVAATDRSPPVYWSDASGGGGAVYPDGTASHPVVGVSWDDAASYCEWVGKRLPTEAEWERSCRGSSGAPYPWGDGWSESLTNVTLVPLADPDDAWAWLGAGDRAPAAPRPVGEPIDGASEAGVCNLAGNASEWVADWYDPEAYRALPDRNPVGTGPPWNRVVRGGAWLFRHDDPDGMADRSRCASRMASHSSDDPRVGFRCARDA